MTRKTESLSYPTNPLAAIRELQELDTKTAGQSVTNQVRDLSRPSIATSSAVAKAHSSEESSAVRPRKPMRTERLKTTIPESEPVEKENPLASAVREMLSQPYTSDPKRGPFTVSTVKIPTEVSERLGWLATVVGKPKQEILAEALKDYFEKVLASG